jgi:hypothetical protein
VYVMSLPKISTTCLPFSNVPLLRSPDIGSVFNVALTC